MVYCGAVVRYSDIISDDSGCKFFFNFFVLYPSLCLWQNKLKGAQNAFLVLLAYVCVCRTFYFVFSYNMKNLQVYARSWKISYCYPFLQFATSSFWSFNFLKDLCIKIYVNCVYTAYYTKIAFRTINTCTSSLKLAL